MKRNTRHFCSLNTLMLFIPKGSGLTCRNKKICHLFFPQTSFNKANVQYEKGCIQCQEISTTNKKNTSNGGRVLLQSFTHRIEWLIAQAEADPESLPWHFWVKTLTRIGSRVSQTTYKCVLSDWIWIHPGTSSDLALALDWIFTLVWTG